MVDGTLIAQPGPDHAVFYYAAGTFNDFSLRLQFSLPGPVDQFGKAIGNSGVFVRFRQPHTKWEDVNAKEARAAANPAWVAVATGFEVQIDEQGVPDYLSRHRTGALYNIAAGEGGTAAEQTFNAGPVLLPRHWYEMEVQVTGETYVIRLRDAEAASATFQTISQFTRNPTVYPDRGLPVAQDSRSGYIGIQAHSGAVAFRRIAVKG